MSSPERQDLEARRAAQTVFDRPLVVEAGAGTGKTTILVARAVSWALGPGWDAARAEILERVPDPPPSDETVAAVTLESIVAITFTEAAAAEMAGRVAGKLAEVATGGGESPGFDPSLIAGVEDPEELAVRARALLGQLDRLTACTIHAFCFALLRRHPLEAGLHPEFTIDARGERLDEIVRNVVEARLKEAYAARDPATAPLVRLATYGVSPRHLAEALMTFAFEGVPAAGLAADPFADERVDGLVLELQSALDEYLALTDGCLKSIARAKKPAETERAVETSAAALEAIRTRGARGLELAGELCAAYESIWAGNAWSHLKAQAAGVFLKSEASTLGDRCAPLASLAARLQRRIDYLRKGRPDFFDAARRSIHPLLAEIEVEARAAGVMTFDGLLRDCWSLLRDHERIRRHERQRIRQLLVDEFQDTDRLQCDIVRYLGLPRQGDGPGLFLVGDPKQSIYGWRNADLEAYDLFVAAVLAAGGEKYSLVRNFRSRVEVLAEVDRAIAPVMVEEHGLQPPFEPLLPGADPPLDDLGPRWSPIEYWVSWSPEAGAGTKSVEATEIEAAAIARDMRALHDAGVRWKDCALLMRNASHVDAYLDGFRDAGVPFVVTSDKQYFRRREVIDASALVRCVVVPTDHVALLTWLRSPIVGVPDAALIPLWARGFPGLLTDLGLGDQVETTTQLGELDRVVEDAAANLPDGVPGLGDVAGWNGVLRDALSGLAELRSALRQEPWDRFMERLRWRMLTEPTEAGRYLGRYRLANLERLFRSIGAGLEGRGGDLQAVLRVLRRSVTQALETEDALPMDAAEDAVQVMTIHKAKGLEFKHVYVAQVHATGRSSERKTFDADRRREGDAAFEYVLFNVPTLDFDEVERRREAVAAAEQVRTLYVAMTRARDRLVLVGNWPHPPRSWRSPPTYSDLLSRRLDSPVPLDRWLADAASTPDGFVDEAGIRWRFPALEEAGATAVGEPPVAKLPTAAAVAADSEALHEARARAAERMGRPWFATASLADGAEKVLAATGVTRESYDRRTAMAIGDVVHRALERWDLGSDPRAEYERRRAAALEELAARLDGDELSVGARETEKLLERLHDGALLRRLVEAGETVVARELPVLLPAEPAAAEGPLIGVSGIVDLVLRRPDGRYTVVDYKTDRVESDEEIEARGELYAGQVGVYARALEGALELDATPAIEIWFLWPDRAWAPR